MRYIKMLGLAVVAASALMVFIGAGTASATELCEKVESPCKAENKWTGTPTILFSLKGSAKLVSTEGETLDTCTGSSVEGPITNLGSSTETVAGEVATANLKWSGCTFTTDTLQGGTLEGHATGGGNGTLTSSSEFRVTINTVLFGSCVYGVTKGTSLGNVTGGGKEEAKFVANAVASRLSGSSLVCPPTSKWTAEYVYTNTTLLFLV